MVCLRGNGRRRSGAGFPFIVNDPAPIPAIHGRDQDFELSILLLFCRLGINASGTLISMIGFNRFLVAAAAVTCVASMATVADAADVPGGPPMAAAPPAPLPGPPVVAAPALWTVTIGLEGRYGPGWPGADTGSYRIIPVPIVGLRRAGTPEHFTSGYDGIGIPIFQTGNFAIGPAAHFRRGRDVGDFSELAGLNDIDFAVELGGFAEFWFTPWLRTRGEITAGVTGHEGVVGYLSADVVVPVGQLQLSAGPRLTLASASMMNTYFGVTAAEAAATAALVATTGLAALPVYTASGGVYSWGAGGKAKFRWSKEWAAHTFLEYSRLSGDAANSPIITQRGNPNQWIVGLGATYSFDMPSLW
jgi:outer membrane protein